MEQVSGSGHRQQRPDAQCAGGFAKNRDIARVATEARDVVADPRERRDLVEQAEIGDAIVEIEEAGCANPVVDRHQHHAVARKGAAVIPERSPSRVVLEHAAGDPQHHGQVCRAQLWGPDVQRQAVCARPTQLGRDQRPHHGRIVRLRRLGTERERLANALPGDRLRRLEQVGTVQRRGKGDALEGMDAVRDRAAHGARFRGHYRSCSCCHRLSSRSGDQAGSHTSKHKLVTPHEGPPRLGGISLARLCTARLDLGQWAGRPLDGRWLNET